MPARPFQVALPGTAAAAFRRRCVRAPADLRRWQGRRLVLRRRRDQPPQAAGGEAGLRLPGRRGIRRPARARVRGVLRRRPGCRCDPGFRRPCLRLWPPDPLHRHRGGGEEGEAWSLGHRQFRAAPVLAERREGLRRGIGFPPLAWTGATKRRAEPSAESQSRRTGPQQTGSHSLFFNELVVETISLLINSLLIILSMP